MKRCTPTTEVGNTSEYSYRTQQHKADDCPNSIDCRTDTGRSSKQIYKSPIQKGIQKNSPPHLEEYPQKRIDKCLNDEVAEVEDVVEGVV